MLVNSYNNNNNDNGIITIRHENVEEIHALFVLVIAFSYFSLVLFVTNVNPSFVCTVHALQPSSPPNSSPLFLVFRLFR